MRTARCLLLLALVCLTVLCWPAASAWAATTERVSVSSSGGEGDGDVMVWRDPSVSVDGRYVVFPSLAANLVPGDTNSATDIFVHDRWTGTTERVSVTSIGEQVYGGSGIGARISADGRFVAFSSGASDLVPGDTNGAFDVFVRDRQTGVTERVSVGSAGEEGNNSSSSWNCSVSADGRFVAFESHASNFVPGDTNNALDVFVRDRLAGVTERVSVSSAGLQGDAVSNHPILSADGRFTAFFTVSNLVPEDANGMGDVFVRDRQTGTTERVSVSSTGEEANGDSAPGAISSDGRFVAFWSYATNLVSGDTNGADDIFVHDRQTGATERVSVNSSGEQGNVGSANPWCAISADGRFVAFGSDATNLVPGDTNARQDVYIHDRQTGITERMSVSTTGEQANALSIYPDISADGRVVAFNSAATNLVPDDTNNVWDVFVRVRWPFRDVSPEQWAYSQTNACVDASIVRGYEDETYLPDLEVTRDQMAVFIARAMNGGEPTGPATVAFTDITNPWANVYIAYCMEHGVAGGYDATHYGPTLPVTRDQMAVFVARSQGWVTIGEDMTTEAPAFEDVPLGHWAGKAIKECVDHGVVHGYDATHYQPDWTVTRDQMAVFVQKAFQLPM